MGIISNMKNKVREEIDAFKNRRAMERDPVILKALIKDKQAQIKREQDFAQDRETLQRLKNSTGTRGAVIAGLGKVKEHLATVKARNEKHEKFKLRNPNSGVMESGMAGKGMHSDLPGNNAIRSLGNGKSLVTQGSNVKSPLLHDKKSKGGVFR